MEIHVVSLLFLRSKRCLTAAQISHLPQEERVIHPHHDKTIIAPRPPDMKAGITPIDIGRENVEVNVTTEIGTAIGVTDNQKSLHTTVALIATAAAEIMAHHPAVQATEAQVEASTRQAVETMVLVVHTERTLIRHRGIESLDMIAGEVDQVVLMGLEAVVLEVEAVMAAGDSEVEIGNVACHQRDLGELLQI